MEHVSSRLVPLRRTNFLRPEEGSLAFLSWPDASHAIGPNGHGCLFWNVWLLL